MVSLKYGELIIFTTNRHWLVLIAWLFVIAAFGAISVLLLPLTGAIADGEVPLLLIGIGVLIAWGAALWDWRNRKFILTDRRLIQTRGILGKQRMMIPLYRIEDISHRFGILGWLIGYGDLIVESAGPEGKVVFNYLPIPEAIQKRIEIQIKRFRVQSCRH